MKHRIWMSMGAIVLGVSTLTIGYAASNSSDEGMCCERMMREHSGSAMGMMGKDHMGMMGSGMPRECEEMMRKHGISAIESPGAIPVAPAS